MLAGVCMQVWVREPWKYGCKWWYDGVMAHVLFSCRTSNGRHVYDQTIKMRAESPGRMNHDTQLDIHVHVS